MIEMVAHEKYYKDVKHEPLCPTVPKDLRTHHTVSPPLLWLPHAPPAAVVPPLPSHKALGC
jgi:hypothetical protein